MSGAYGVNNALQHAIDFTLRGWLYQQVEDARAQRPQSQLRRALHGQHKDRRRGPTILGLRNQSESGHLGVIEVEANRVPALCQLAGIQFARTDFRQAKEALEWNSRDSVRSAGAEIHPEKLETRHVRWWSYISNPLGAEPYHSHHGTVDRRNPT